ncbi:ATP-binding cassette domain-containing protein [Paracoccus suum]|uniref:ATP-binding cassette domain-containing protein n=1 Tax=Paracoccus suum TaxID=2259340 RepID=A0A344PMI7_9RHOB|nr:oligopeptide/dipeptide ABC transporter ATP-binding protein [Paracoccus suum]AXC50592.1 ATP-binding cassette domain-containing protein [Paracoccus suum]
MTAAPVLEVRGLHQRFKLRDSLLGRLGIGRPPVTVHAVNGVDFTLARGEVLGLVGESGCGKSTVARTIARLHEPASGKVFLDGTDISHLGQRALLPHRARMQMIFQDPYASLNPRQRVRDIVAEPMRAQGVEPAEARERAVGLLDRVGLTAEQGRRFPHQFSGGQRQRIGIARALSVHPALIVADEPVSALDVSVQAQILNLMKDLQQEFGLSYLFIGHDLGVIHHIADRIAVMYLGLIVETAPKDRLFARPRHPYTRALFAAAPSIHPGREPAPAPRGEVPSALALPSGCVFRGRCPFAWDRCAAERPVLRDAGDGQSVACHLLEEPERDKT